MPEENQNAADIIEAALRVQRQHRAVNGPARPAGRNNPFDAPRQVLRGDMQQQWAVFAGGIPAFPEEQKTTMATTKKSKSDMTMLEYWGINPIPQVFQANELFKGKQLFGVELEIESFPVHHEDASSDGFRFISDGSLRGQAVEAVAWPASKESIISSTVALWEKYGVKSDKNFSDRTSIHVHANVLEFKESHLRNLILVYSTIEDLLFDFIGQDRYKNIFCVPWSEAGVNISSARGVLDTPRRWQKYTALNLAPIRTQGTVEFRHMEGHADVIRLNNWLTIIEDLLEYCYKSDSDQITECILGLNNTSEYVKWATQVLPNSHHLFSPEQIRTKLARGVIEAKLSLI